jgi:arylsulfatase A-like enzyme
MGNRVYSGDKGLISKLFSENGYVCGLAGKLHLASAATGAENRSEDGFSSFFHSHDPWQGYETGNNAYTKWLFSQGFAPETAFSKGNGKRAFYGMKSDLPSEFRQTRWCFDRAKEFIDAHRKTPWLFMVNTFDPHPPFDAPYDLEQKYLDRELEDPIYSAEEDCMDFGQTRDFYHQTDRCTPPDEKTRRCKASYYGMIELIDREVGAIIDYLKEKGEWKDTIVIFQSDHGEMLGDHGLMRKGCRFFEGAVRVPLIITYGKRFACDRRYEGITELRDVFPTLLDACGIDGNYEGDAISLLPILTARKSDIPNRHRSYARCEYYKAIDTRFIRKKNAKDCYATMYVTDRYKIVLYHGISYGQLFDLEEDPREIHNLWNDDAYKTLKYRLILESYEKTVRAQEANPEIIAEF